MWIIDAENQDWIEYGERWKFVSKVDLLERWEFVSKADFFQ